MTKLQKAFAVIMATVLLLFITMGAGVASYADEVQEPPAITEETEQTETGIDGVAEQFVAYLKDKYGADYEYYYNLIIEQWGSVEGYLLAFGNKLPEEYQSGWDKFVGWLNEYAPVWVTALTVVVLITALIVGKSKIKKLKEWFTALAEKLVNKRLAPIENELNLQSKATLSILHSQKALFGSSEKFSENVKELEQAEKELNNE